MTQMISLRRKFGNILQCRRTSLLKFVLFIVLCLLVLVYYILSPYNCNDYNTDDNAKLKRRGWKFFYYATTYYAHKSIWRETFDFTRCPNEKRCAFVSTSSEADVMLFHMGDIYLQWWTHVPQKQKNQIWILYGQESPTTTLWMTSPLNGYFNWTLSHQRNSDLVVDYAPSGFWRKKKVIPHSIPNYWKGRTGGAFIVTSNCWTASGRIEYINELSKHYPVDIYGSCGKSCKTRSDNCDFKNMAKEYKFYLSFENSLCKDYISEKYFRNAVQVDIVPVVRGGQSRADYERASAPNSFIYADDFPSAEKLGRYLKQVGDSMELYNKFLEWKQTHEFVATDKPGLPCIVCTAAHNQTLLKQHRVHTDLSKMWNKNRDCRDPVVKPGRNAFKQVAHYVEYLLNIN